MQKTLRSPIKPALWKTRAVPYDASFFAQVAQTHKADHIALGHQQDDQIETFFIRLLRGAGLTGLACIRPLHGKYIHPLLSTTKQQILSYLTAQQLPYLEDYTNYSSQHLRNRIRHEVLPVLSGVDDRFSANIIRTIDNLQEADNYLHALIKTTLNDIALSIEPITIDLERFRSLAHFMQKQIFIQWLIAAKVPFTQTESFMNEALRFLARKEGGFHQLGPNWGIKKEQQRAVIKKQTNR